MIFWSLPNNHYSANILRVPSIYINAKREQKEITVEAQIVEALPNTLFKIKRNDTGEEMLSYLAGKMRLHRIRVLIGDKVLVTIDPYGGKGRIIKRI